MFHDSFNKYLDNLVDMIWDIYGKCNTDCIRDKAEFFEIINRISEQIIYSLLPSTKDSVFYQHDLTLKIVACLDTDESTKYAKNKDEFH